MGYRVKEMIPGLDYEDLKKLQFDLNKGGLHLRKLVDDQVKQLEKKHSCICANCMADIDDRSAETYTLVFGPHDFRKKATFCGLDCLQYFLGNIKMIKRG
ncbi:hypothetical protein H6504_00080 [Candidatus Woesearchaeota archaeon]|nr:hypothetical protein [Candidatus Woesearchaeota archaeon]